MKFSKLLFGLFMVISVSSCNTNTTNLQKITGSYKGLFNNTGSEQTIVFTAGSADNKVNMSASGGWFHNQVLMDVSLTSSGETVNFSYTSATTVDFEVTSVSGSYNGNTLSFVETYNYPGGPESVNFSGTKQ